MELEWKTAAVTTHEFVFLGNILAGNDVARLVLGLSRMNWNKLEWYRCTERDFVCENGLTGLYDEVSSIFYINLLSCVEVDDRQNVINLNFSIPQRRTIAWLQDSFYSLIVISSDYSINVAIRGIIIQNTVIHRSLFHVPPPSITILFIVRYAQFHSMQVSSALRIKTLKCLNSYIA